MINFVAIRMLLSAVLLLLGMIVFFAGLSSGDPDAFWYAAGYGAILAIAGAAILPKN